LIFNNQKVEVTICSKTGSSKVTTPSPTAFWGSGTSTTPSDSLYQLVDRGASGNSANINFGVWTIEDIHPGCGKFEKFGVSASGGRRLSITAIEGSTALSFLQYPPPGV
jgi:hypothetical protein